MSVPNLHLMAYHGFLRIIKIPKGVLFGPLSERETLHFNTLKINFYSQEETK